jgi:histidyl-tRNA synthetase
MLERLAKMKGGIEQLDEAEKLVGDLEGFSYLRALCGRLESSGVKRWQIDLGVVRGLDYYTGMVFEIDVPSLGAEKQVCGGGSYALAEVFGGQPIESTGYAIGFDRVLLAIENEGKAAAPIGPMAYVVPMGEKTMQAALGLVAELRASGIETDMELMGRGLSKALKYADAIRAEKVIIIGEKEIAEGGATVRDLRTGEQKLMKFGEIPGALRS